MHAPVGVQMKILFQKGCFGVLLGGSRSPVPHEMISQEATCFLMTWFGYFP
jgi:hypothetical protein